MDGRRSCFASSGCFFNGVTQVCFFEPFLPLLPFFVNFNPFYSGFGLAGDLQEQLARPAFVAEPHASTCLSQFNDHILMEGDCVHWQWPYLGGQSHDLGSGSAEVLAGAFFFFFGAGCRAFFSSWSACRWALSALVRFSAMLTVSPSPDSRHQSCGFNCTATRFANPGGRRLLVALFVFTSSDRPRSPTLPTNPGARTYDSCSCSPIL